MGYVATIVVNVDALHLVKEDPKFGEKVYYAVQSVDDKEKNIKVGCYFSAATAIEKHDSSYTVPVLVGGYNDCVLGNISVGYTAGENTELEVLKQIAVKHGFSLRKKKIG